VSDDAEKRVLSGGAHVIDPFLGHAEGHQFKLAQVSKSFGLDNGVAAVLVNLSW
jgi:hypothetical protein